MNFIIKGLVFFFVVFFALETDYTKASADTKKAVDAPFRTQQIDLLNLKNNVFATRVSVDLSLSNSGAWIEDLNAKFITWTHTISEADASSLNFGFSEFVLPTSAIFTICDEDGLICQEFTPSKTTKHHLELWTPILKGNTAKFSLKVLKSEKALVRIKLTSINKGLPRNADRQISQECLIDVLCSDEFPQINDFEAEIQSVGLITIEGTRICSGVLLNNAREDFTPYFLTARHCGINAENAPSIVVHWNYENTTCRLGSASNKIEGDGSLAQFNTGAQYLSDLQRSDFTLLRLDEPVIDEARAFFAGWDARSQKPIDVTTVHHANTEEKRITFGAGETAISRHFGEGDDPSLDHIRVPKWDISSTAGGSSGGPLFDQNHRVVGQLHGGLAACGNDESDWFGRFYTSWLGDEVPERQLKHWLDPDNIGIEFIDGIWGDFQPLSLSIAGSQTSTIDCKGDSTGAILIDILNGSGNFEYSIDGGENFQTESLFQNLGAGEYFLVVKDANENSTESVTLVLTEPEALTLDFKQDYNQLTILIEGGNAPYTVSQGTQSDMDTIYQNLPVGEYKFIVTDANGCIQNLDVDFRYDAFQALASVLDSISCFDSNDGVIALTHSGTVGPYQYRLNDGEIMDQNIFTELSPGSYIGQIIDSLGNTVATESIELVAPSPIILDLFNLEENVFVGITGGLAPFLYQYDSGEPTENNFFTFGSNVDLITVIDASGCSTTIENSFLSSTADFIDNSLPIKLYPNPANHTLFLEFGDLKIDQFSIMDVQGRMVKWHEYSVESHGLQEINLGDLSSGIYFIQVLTESGYSKTMKFNVL